MASVEAGKRPAKTCGVQAPAVMIRRVQGRSVSVPVWVERMRTLESELWMSVEMERMRAGWCRCAPRERVVVRRNWERRRGSLVASGVSVRFFWGGDGMGGGDAHLGGTVALTDDLDLPAFLLRQPGRAVTGDEVVLARGLRPRRAFAQPIVASFPVARVAAVRQACAGAATPAPLLAAAMFSCELLVQVEAEGAEGRDDRGVPVAREEAGAEAGCGGEEAGGGLDEVD